MRHFKLELVLFFWSIFAISNAEEPFLIQKRYEKWANRHSKEVSLSKYLKFEVNARRVAELNALNTSAEFSLDDSPFADWSEEEFRETVLMPPRPSPLVFSSAEAEETVSKNGPIKEDPPSHWDWVEHGGVVTPVKDQGSLGTCWAFAAVGCLEGQLGLKNLKTHKDAILKSPESLSVEQLVECDSKFNASATDADCGEFGGWPYLAFEDLLAFGGIFSEEQVPYCSGTLDKHLYPGCFPCMAQGYSQKFCGDHSDLYCDKETTLLQKKGGLCSSDGLSRFSDSRKGLRSTQFGQPDFAARLKGWRPISQDERQMQKELLESGPLAVALDATFLQFYKKGVFDPPSLMCSAKTLNHAVLLVGFGEEKGQLFWKAKNSWGKDFGEEGYFRIARGKAKCGINAAVALAELH